jgi:membrane protease YdiL (CAAX protease family)
MNRRAMGPILVFLVVSAAASPLLSLMQAGSAIDPVVFQLTVLSTAVGAAVVWVIWRGRLAYPPTVKRGLARPLLGGAAAIAVLAGLLFELAHAQHAPWRTAGMGDLGGPLAILLLVQLLGAGAEEVGWRGLVQPLLETRLRPALAALITGALFAVGHFYLAFSISALAFTLFVAAATAMSLLLAVFTLGRSFADRVAIATVLHFLINMATFGLFSDGDGSVLYFADLATVFGVGGVIALAIMLKLRPTARSRSIPG